MSEKRKTISIPKMIREASFVPATVDKEKRTVDMVWTTGARVLRSPWFSDDYYEELEVTDQAVDLSRLNAGAPLLNVHSTYELEDVLGVVERAWIENGLGKATVRFSERDDVAPIWKDVMTGIIRNVSVGYEINQMEKVQDGSGQTPVFRVTKWTPQELSLVPVGADAGAGVRSKGPKMNECLVLERANTQTNGGIMEKDQTVVVPPAQTPAAIQPDLELVRKEERAAIQKRSQEITKAVRAAKLPDDFAIELINSDATIDQAREKIIDKWSESAKEPVIHSHVSTGGKETEIEMRASVENALLHRYRPDKFALTDGGRNFRGLTLIELTRQLMEKAGVSTRGLVPVELAKRGFEGTSDFPAILANVANKTLRMGYEGGIQTFKPFCRQGLAKDFKQISRTQLGDAPNLVALSPSGEIKRGAITDGKEVYQLSTYATIVALNRQAIINDDMSAFTRIPSDMGKAVADLESDVVWAVITVNAAMGDAIALFHATHGNLAGSGAVISVTSASAARAAMRKQKNLQSRPLNLMPKMIIVPPELEGVAEQLVGPITPNVSTSFNPFSQKLGIIVEPRLSANSATAYYFAADPAAIDLVEFSYLEGQEGAYIETRQGFDVDGMEIKVRHDFAAKALDWRGLYKNPGA